MNIRKFKQLFGSRRRAEDGSPIPLSWIADPFTQQAILIDRDSGRVLSYVEHDGYGKCEATVIVSPWRALRLLRRHPGFLVSLLTFPRVAVELLRLRTDSVASAQRYVEAVLELQVAS
jgi:hypothetical protein